MPDTKPTAFQTMNGCAACKHATGADPTGKNAAAYGKGYWCSVLGKGVDAKDGVQCPSWEYQA